MALLKLVWTTLDGLCSTCVYLSFLQTSLCTLSHSLTLNPKAVPGCTYSVLIPRSYGVSQYFGCCPVITDFNPLYALVLERNSPRCKQAGKTHLLTLQKALFRVLLRQSLDTWPWLSWSLLCSPGWTLNLFHPYCLGFFVLLDSEVFF